tara:strand:+ start:6605 stop:6937 length:333 start_codon:yes stop_codon:yes gene_type:complete
MGRRINIQYSIDIDDLGLEVGRLLGTAYDGMDFCAKAGRLKDGEDQTGRPLSLEKMEHIDELRRKLAAIDYTLQDTHNIISAYLSFKSEEAMPTTEDPPRGKESEEPPQE